MSGHGRDLRTHFPSRPTSSPPPRRTPGLRLRPNLLSVVVHEQLRSGVRANGGETRGTRAFGRMADNAALTLTEDFVGQQPPHHHHLLIYYAAHGKTEGRAGRGVGVGDRNGGDHGVRCVRSEYEMRVRGSRMLVLGCFNAIRTQKNFST